MDISVQQQGSVAVITWNEGENRINLDSLGRLNEILDELESTDGSLGVVLTGQGKFFCNGLDLERFGQKMDEFGETIRLLNRTIGRLLLFPAYSVAALNGHTFAGGALISCGFDERIMREDRGFWCMNEAEIGLALDDRLWRILENRLPRATATKAALTAYRFNAVEAQQWGIVQDIASEAEVLTKAVALAEKYASLNRKTLVTHKQLAHGDAAEFLGYSYR